MNIFYIPSWYPSQENPLYGIFIKEQIEEIAHNHPQINLGISYWGQGNNNHLLWARDHVKNIVKILAFTKLKGDTKILYPNCREYYSPALTWTRRLFDGNRKRIIKANLTNLDKFEDDFGKVDLIHAQATYPAGLIAQNLARQRNYPFVITARMSPFPFTEFLKRSGRLSPLITTPLRKANRIIAISKDLEKTLHSFEFKNTTVIHNSTRDIFSSVKPGQLQSRFTFLSIGRLVHQKGFDILIRSLSQISEDCALEIAGTGNEGDRLKSLSTKLKINDRITWLDVLNRNEVRDAIQRCHCLILSSRHETLGNVLIEAIACGKPIIATTCGGPDDIVNETNGLLAKVNDPEDLAAKMIHMIRNYQRYDPKAIRADFEKRFSSTVITPKIVALYNEVIENFRGGL